MIRLSFTPLNRHNEELDKFLNSGKFARDDYRRMWHLRLDKGWKAIYVGSPSLLQTFKSAVGIWRGIDNPDLEIDRNEHPVLMNVYSVRPDNLTPIAEPTNRTYYKQED